MGDSVRDSMGDSMRDSMGDSMRDSMGDNMWDSMGTENKEYTNGEVWQTSTANAFLCQILE